MRVMVEAIENGQYCDGSHIVVGSNPKKYPSTDSDEREKGELRGSTIELMLIIGNVNGRYHYGYE